MQGKITSLSANSTTNHIELETVDLQIYVAPCSRDRPGDHMVVVGGPGKDGPSPALSSILPLYFEIHTFCAVLCITPGNSIHILHISFLFVTREPLLNGRPARSMMTSNDK